MTKPAPLRDSLYKPVLSPKFKNLVRQIATIRGMTICEVVEQAILAYASPEEMRQPPAPPVENHPCPHCGGHTRVVRRKEPRRKCTVCGRTKALSGRKPGGQPKYGNRPLTNAERQALWRKQQKARANS